MVVAAVVAVGVSVEARGQEARQGQALSMGAPVEGGDAGVVALVAAEEPTRLRCTGVLISERVVLTAAHCVSPGGVEGVAVFFGDALGGDGQLVALLEVVQHPEHREGVDHDLALALLAQPAPAAPAVVLTEALLEATPGATLRLVGFGATAAGAADGDRKREGFASVTGVEAGHVVLGAAPSLPCNGDSGGPAFLMTASGERLAAIISRGDEGCDDYGRGTRVDVHAAAFIAPYLSATATGALDDGAACLFDAQCQGGRCAAALDAPALRFCGRPCEGDGGCVAPMRCQGGRCRHPTPSPGTVGARCEGHADCRRGAECLDEGWCSQRCVSARGGDGGADCPEGYACAHRGGVDFFCEPLAPRDEGGCAVFGGGARGRGGRGALAWLVVGVLVARRARRR